ncbi:uncharacterized protein At4g04775-like [Eutrema salsugineum]|uniref:uncharacterized protein At4g04775-like n=1 Tax=Eutrema salsugineum TaxID=72664 RepID=UPI000CED7182|nr:uncharacterized protein At4g04775-like [Eutrema salsugineum]
MGRAYADTYFGIPYRCFCGQEPIIEASTGACTPGRKYYACLDWFKEGTGPHIWKWWDDAIMEEFNRVKRNLDKHNEKLQMLAGLQAFDPRLESCLDTLEMSIYKNNVCSNIRDMTEQISQLQREIASQKELYTVRGDVYLILAIMVVFAAISDLFSREMN